MAQQKSKFGRTTVEKILENWLEYEGGAKAVNLEGGGSGWRGEPESLLWTCTVGSKVERCPQMPWDPGDQSTMMPVVEQVARLRIAETALNGQLGQARALIARLRPSDVARKIAEDEAVKLREAVDWVDKRLAFLLQTPHYRQGMTYLEDQLLTACSQDKKFRAYTGGLLSPERQSPTWLQALCAHTHMEGTDIAQVIGVSGRIVQYWLKGERPLPAKRKAQIEAALVKKFPELRDWFARNCVLGDEVNGAEAEVVLSVEDA